MLFWRQLNHIHCIGMLYQKPSPISPLDPNELYDQYDQSTENARDSATTTLSTGVAGLAAITKAMKQGQLDFIAGASIHDYLEDVSRRRAIVDSLTPFLDARSDSIEAIRNNARQLLPS